MTHPELLEKIYAAVKFIARGQAIPDAIALRAAHAAAKEIVEYQREFVAAGFTPAQTQNEKTKAQQPVQRGHAQQEA